MPTIIVPVRIAGFRREILDGELLLFDPARNLLVHANQTAAVILELCDGQRDVDEIVALLCAAYPDAQDEITRDVPETIQTLTAQGVLGAA